MKCTVVLAAGGVVSIACAQEWRFELSNPMLSPEDPSTFVTLSIDPGPAPYAFADAILSVHASEAGWSDLIGLLTYPAQDPGMISGGDVTGISVGQLVGFGRTPASGRIAVWRGTFTATDFSARSIDLNTDTTRFVVFTDRSWTREARTPIEGLARIEIVPAPAGLALLGLGGAMAASRRRRAGECRRVSR